MCTIYLQVVRTSLLFGYPFQTPKKKRVRKVGTRTIFFFFFFFIFLFFFLAEIRIRGGLNYEESLRFIYFLFFSFFLFSFASTSMHILLGKKSKVLFLFLIFLHETSSIKLDGFNLFFLENFVCRKMEFSAGSQMGRDPRR